MNGGILWATAWVQGSWGLVCKAASGAAKVYGSGFGVRGLTLRKCVGSQVRCNQGKLKLMSRSVADGTSHVSYVGIHMHVYVCVCA